MEYSEDGFKFYIKSEEDGLTAIIRELPKDKSEIVIPNYFKITRPPSNKIAACKVTGIDIYYNHPSVTKLTIPNSIRDVFESSHWLENLSTISIKPGTNEKFKTEDGILFTSSGKTLVWMPAARTGCYDLPQSTDSIAAGAFYSTSLSSINLHNDVCFIGHGAFSNLKDKLGKGVWISNSNPYYGLIEGCIYSKITNCYISCSISNRGTYLIPDFITEIGAYAFDGCDDIETIIIPKSVVSIGQKAFYSINKLIFLGSINGIGDYKSIFNIHNNSIQIYLGKDELNLLRYIFYPYEDSLHIIESAFGLSAWSCVFGIDYYQKSTPIIDNLSISGIAVSENKESVKQDSNGYYKLRDLQENTWYTPVVRFTIGKYQTEANLSRCQTNKRQAYFNTANITQTSAEIRINATEDTTCKPTKCGLTYDGKEYFANKDNIVNLNGLSLNQTYSVYPFAYYGEELISESRKDFTTKDVSYTLLTKNIGPTHCELDVDVDAGDAQIISSGFSNGRDRIIATGLAPDKDYTFTLNVNTKAGQSSNNYKITTSKLEIETLQPKVVSSGCAIVGATTNISDYENSAGFQWKKYDAPESLKPNEANAIIYDGSMEGYIKNLQPTSFYNVRVFYKDADGKYYFGDWVTFDPADFSYFEPTVHTYATTECSHNTAFVKGYAMQGSEPITEQGFQYWEEGNRYINVKANESPQIHTITATGQIMTATIENLKSETAYKFRAYARTVSGIITGEEQEFITKSAPSGVEDVAVSPKEPKIAAYYNIGGLRSEKPFEGLNIVIYTDGTTRKIIYRQ